MIKKGLNILPLYEQNQFQDLPIFVGRLLAFLEVNKITLLNKPYIFL